VLLYDRQTESLWSQIKREAVTGPLTGTNIKTLPSTLTTWKKWKKRHPDTLVLSTDTGYIRDYSKDPYESYYTSPFRFFGFRGKVSPELPEKELVLGVDIGAEKKAYPVSVLKKMKTPFEDTVSGQKITVHFDSDTEEAFATDKEKNRVPGVLTYWYVWNAFHPDTTVFKGE
jgi:hypothetical protein